ncbi:MAG: hypothetical protein LUD68_03075 [Rikenellaceae bacterium]|nr:hypothetical protein [Rikenellaceae bacterium]
MKNLKHIAMAAAAGIVLFSSCSDEWDKHYSLQDQEVDTENLIIMDADIADFLASESAYSSIYQLLQSTGVLDEMLQREQVFTLLTVDNNSFVNETDDQDYLAKTYISDLAFSPANMTDGQRILMKNGKYLAISIDESGSIAFNDTRAVKIYKLNDGYIYEVAEMIHCPKSLLEVIESLNDNYSMFRDSVLSRQVLKFDRENSLPIGVDATGSTVYDSTWIITNPYFADAGLDIMSEGITATVLIPSNEVVLASWADAWARLEKWQLTDFPETLPDSVFEQWFFQAAFFDKMYSQADLAEDRDISSIFSQKWRTSVQQLDLNSPIEISNGIGYYVTHLKTPTNVLIWRLKDYFETYQYLTEEQINTYFKTEGLTFRKVANDQNSDFDPMPGVFPATAYPCLYYDVVNADKEEAPVYVLDFLAYHYYKDANDRTITTEYLVPPGTYDFYMGFNNAVCHDLKIYINDVHQYSLASTNYSNFHYDRVNGKYPYGYDASLSSDKNATKYGRAGGSMGSITFDNEDGTPLNIRIECTSTVGSTKGLILHHWNLEPTDDCY